MRRPAASPTAHAGQGDNPRAQRWCARTDLGGLSRNRIPPWPKGGQSLELRNSEECPLNTGCLWRDERCNFFLAPSPPPTEILALGWDGPPFTKERFFVFV